MSTILKEYYSSVIHHECTPSDWADLENHIKMLHEDDLALFAERLGISPHSTWQHYMGEIEHRTWGEVIRAYERVTRRTY